MILCQTRKLFSGERLRNFKPTKINESTVFVLHCKTKRQSP